MTTLTPKQEQQTIKELIAEGYTLEESKKILQGHKEAQKKVGKSAEIVYKHLLANKKVYA